MIIVTRFCFLLWHFQHPLPRGRFLEYKYSIMFSFKIKNYNWIINIYKKIAKIDNIRIIHCLYCCQFLVFTNTKNSKKTKMDFWRLLRTNFKMGFPPEVQLARVAAHATSKLLQSGWQSWNRLENLHQKNSVSQ